MTRLHGIDVSSHNGYIDVAKYDFVIIRACWGTHTDSKLDYWVNECEKKKTAYGLYIYSYGLSYEDGKSEAEFLLATIQTKNLKPSVGVWFDMEDADHYKLKRGALNKTVITDVCKGFIDEFKKSGYYYGIYSTRIWFRDYMPTIKCNKWIAHWDSNNGQVGSDLSGECDIHQYTSVPFDKDICFKDFEHFKKKGSVKEVENVGKLMTSQREGIQDFLCPFKKLYITQGTGVGTHIGTQAIDVVNGNGAKAPYYAPADLMCFATYPSNGQAMWVTQNKVRCPNGYIGHVVMCTAHDETLNFGAGFKIKQGQQIGNMGNAGNSLGIHCHIQCAQTSDKSWTRNRYGVWHFNWEKDPTDIFYMDGVKILNYTNAGWKFISDEKAGKINYRAHCQTYGWMNWTKDGGIAGTTGRAKRMEALQIYTTDGTVIERVEAHMQKIGWKTYEAPSKDTVIGTTGQSRRLEALKIKTSKPCKMRAHVQNKGWTDWVDCDGKDMIGTTGKSLRLEAIEIKRV